MLSLFYYRSARLRVLRTLWSLIPIACTSCNKESYVTRWNTIMRECAYIREISIAQLRYQALKRHIWKFVMIYRYNTLPIIFLYNTKLGRRKYVENFYKWRIFSYHDRFYNNVILSSHRSETKRKKREKRDSRMFARTRANKIHVYRTRLRAKFSSWRGVFYCERMFVCIVQLSYPSRAYEPGSGVASVRCLQKHVSPGECITVGSVPVPKCW